MTCLHPVVRWSRRVSAGVAHQITCDILNLYSRKDQPSIHGLNDACQAIHRYWSTRPDSEAAYRRWPKSNSKHQPDQATWTAGRPTASEKRYRKRETHQDPERGRRTRDVSGAPDDRNGLPWWMGGKMRRKGAWLQFLSFLDIRVQFVLFSISAGSCRQWPRDAAGQPEVANLPRNQPVTNIVAIIVPTKMKATKSANRQSPFCFLPPCPTGLAAHCI